MPSDEKGLSSNQRFTVQVTSFESENSVSLSNNEQQLVLIDDSEPNHRRQLIVRLNEQRDEPPKARRPIDGVAPDPDFLVALLSADRFLPLLTLLYDARRENQPVVIALQTDAVGRISTFEPRVVTDSCPPGPHDRELRGLPSVG